MRSLLTIVILTALLAACGGDAPPEQSGPSEAADPAQEAARANEIYAAYFEESLQLNPLQATFLGDHRYNDQLPNFLGQEHRDRLKDFWKSYLKQIKELDDSRFTGQDRINYDMFVRMLEDELEGTKYPEHLIPINQFYSIPNLAAQLGSGRGAQPFRNAQDYEDWLKRVDGLVVILDQAIDNMRTGMKRGVVQPRILMERVIPQLDALLAGPVEQSIFYAPVTNFPETVDAEARERLQAAYERMVENEMWPAIRRLRTFLTDHYLDAARDTHGMGDLPNGENWYAYRVASITSTDLSPEEIHEIGLREVERIHGEMRKVMAEVGFEGSLDEFFEYTRDNPRFHFSSEEELLDAYRGFRATVDPKLDKLFSRQPKADFEIRPVEAYRNKSASGASYMRASKDGSRPGIFYVNTYDLPARPRWAMESLYLHEAAPGHHFQIALQQELEDIPEFRKTGGTTAFVEGWGLYAESLGKELGVYEDPYQYFGALSAELWRAIRLVVDTGLHAKGWNRERVLNYMYKNAPVKPARAVSEAERYMAIPGQALAYKVGQLKIRQLRNRAEQALGDRFDVRAFHAQVLEDGALPLDILERKIDQWLIDQGAELPLPSGDTTGTEG